MKLRKLFLIVSVPVILLLLVTMPTSIISANAARWPDLTVIVDFPPDDLALFLRSQDGSIDNAVELEKSKTAWETYFRLRYWPSDDSSRAGSVLVVQTGNRSFECALSEYTAGTYNAIIKLNIASGTVSDGNSLTRTVILISLRVAITLLIEGLIFYAFGYRKKASWICFVIINLFTQGWLNKMLCGGPNYSYQANITLIFIEPVIFIVEAVFFSITLAPIIKEQTVGKAIAYTFIANIASLILGALMLSMLPL